MSGYRTTFEEVNKKRESLKLSKFEQDSMNWACEYIKGSDLREEIREKDLKDAKRVVGTTAIVFFIVGSTFGCVVVTIAMCLTIFLK